MVGLVQYMAFLTMYIGATFYTSQFSEMGSATRSNAWLWTGTESHTLCILQFPAAANNIHCYYYRYQSNIALGASYVCVYIYIF